MPERPAAPSEAAGRSGRRRRREVSDVPVQRPWRTLAYPTPPAELLDAEQVERIHKASLRVLAEIGMDFLHPEALDLLRAAGADVEPGTQRVRFDPALIEELIATAPSSFPLVARNPDRTVMLGADHLVCATVGSAPNVSDLIGGRRRGNFADYQDLLRLGQSLNSVHIFGGYPVEPVDLPPSTRHLDCLQAFATLSDKAFHAYSLGRARIVDALEIVRIAHGITVEELKAAPRLFTIINTSSPLRLDGPMIEGMIEMARHNQIVVVTPFTLSGAMAPATIPGALVQQNAEALAGVAFTQVANPGAPAVYGGFTSNVDMKSGAPAFGTPEYAKAVIAGGQLARRYGLPYRSSNANASNAVDVQATYETCFSIWAAVMGHANLMMHGAGWLEGGLCASFEKMVVDAEILGAMAAFLEPLTIDDETLAVDAIAEVGPGGHFFGATHTLQRYETAFYAPFLSDWRNFGAWTDAGAKDTTSRAHELSRRLLHAYEPPPLDAARVEELNSFVERRKREGGAPAD